MAMIRWPIPYEHKSNGYEVVGRYVAQTLLLESFVDMILLAHGANPRRLIRQPLTSKSADIKKLVDRTELGFRDWHDLPEMINKVAKNRVGFVHHTLTNTGEFPAHYVQGRLYSESVSEEQLREQEREVFVASEVCRQLLQRLTWMPEDGTLHGRSDVDWDEVVERHARITAAGTIPPRPAAGPPG